MPSRAQENLELKVKVVESWDLWDSIGVLAVLITSILICLYVPAIHILAGICLCCACIFFFQNMERAIWLFPIVFTFPFGARLGPIKVAPQQNLWVTRVIWEV